MLTGMINTESYHLIEDSWVAVSQKLARLKEIARITTDFPGDKYKMQAHLAKIYFSKYPSCFSLDDFVSALEVASILSLEDVNDYERLLIEILTTIDDETIRNSIVEKLNTQGKNWVYATYGADCVFDRAIQQGNIGLVRWLKLDNLLNRNTINMAVFMAVEVGQWQMVDYLCRSSNYKHKSQQKILKELLPLAAEAGQLSLVTFLCETAITRWQGKPVGQAFVKAAINSQLPVAQYFLSIGAFCPHLLAKTFAMVIHHERISMIEFFGNLPENPLLLRAVRDGLLHKSEDACLHVIKQLCELRTNAPSQEMIGDAFLRSIKHCQFQVAGYFCSLPSNSPSQEVVDTALSKAIVSGHLNSVVFLFGLNDHYPSEVAIERALQKAIKLKRTDFIDYLFSITVVASSKKAAEKQFQSSVKIRNLAVKKSCCTLNQPNVHAIQSALKQASSNENLDMKPSLRGLLPFAPRRPIVVTPPQEKFDGAKKSVSCNSLNTLGLFAFRSSTPQRRASSSDCVESVSPAGLA